MNVNMQKTGDWVLNPSKRFPGKFYYFNVTTGETVWSLNGAEPKFCGNINSYKQDMVHNCREPTTPPNENIVTSGVFNPRKSYTSTPNHSFGNAVFQKYINPNEPIYPNIIWAPIPMFIANAADRRSMLDQNTQTSEPDRDLLVQTCSIPLSQRFGLLGNNAFSSSTGNSYRIPVKEYTTSTPLKESWKINEDVPERCDNIYKKAEIPQVKFKRKLDAPKLILKEAKLKKLVDKTTCTPNLISKAVDTENSGLCQRDKADDSVNDGSKEDSLKRLDECDLRHVLRLKRRKSVDLGVLYREKQERETNVLGTARKKKVSFNLNCADDDCLSIQRDEEKLTYNSSVPIKLLKKICKVPANDEWYISVDLGVLLDDFDFIMSYISADNSCKLLVPESMVKCVEDLAVGEHGGRSSVILARQIHRRLGDLEHVQVVETEEGSSVMEDVYKACITTMDVGVHVVLITKYEKLEKIAKSFGIQVYNLDYIKNSKFPTAENVYDGVNTKNNLFLQKADEFDPFILRKNVNTVSTFERHPRLNSDSTLFDYNNEDINDSNADDAVKDNAFDICHNIEQLNIHGELLNIKRVVDNKDKTNVINNNCNKNKTTTSIFDHIDNNNECFNRNNGSLVKLTKTLANNMFERERTITNNYNDKMHNLRNDTVTHDKNNDNNYIKENIWNVVNERSDIKRYEQTDSIEVKLKRFEVKDRTVENIIALRLDELKCCYVQIVEDFINFVFEKNKEMKDQIPFFLRDGLIRLREMYFNKKDIKFIIDKLLALCKFCPMKGNLMKAVEPKAFMKMLGCGLLLVESMEDALSEDFTETKVMLASLMKDAESLPSNEDLEQVETTLSRIERETGAFRTNFVKPRRDIVEYLKRHFVEWKSYDDYEMNLPENEEPNSIKIFRTSGRNLNTFRIDSKKRISFENPQEINLETKRTDKHTDRNIIHKDVQKTIVNNNSIDVIEDKNQANFDLDELNYSEIAETMTVDDDGSKNDNKIDFVDLTRSDSVSSIRDVIDNCDVRDSTVDSGFENEVNACTLIRSFLTELSASFKLIYTFVDKCVKEFRDEDMTDETKKRIVDKANQTHTHIADIIEKLKAIIERESSDNTLKSLLLKAGTDVAEDKRMTRYRQTVTKCLEQAQILENCLKIMSSLANESCDLSVSSRNEVNHFNIFE